jgi:O-antigen/teichoic acid export membrane protein
MINRIKEIKKDELVAGSAILFIMIVLYNFFNYIFQMSMAKFLGPADYSILAVLMSIIYVFAIPAEVIQTVVTKYTSILSVREEKGKIKDLLIRSLKKGLILSSILFIIFCVISIFISSFLSINYNLLVITGFFIFLVFLIPPIRGVLQGRKKFFTLGKNMLLESTSKLILSIILVILGFKVFGAIVSVILGTSLALIFGFIPIKDIIKSKRENFDAINIYSKNLPIIIATISIVLIYSIDIILARRFFTPELAGQYAFISLIGKVIIFVSSAIGKAMFPISTREYEIGKNSNVLKKSIILVMIMSVASLIVYLAIPEITVKIISLGSDQYVSASNILFFLGLAYSLISFSYIIVLFNLSINKMNKSSWLLSLFLIIQVILLSIFNDNLIEYSLATLFSSLLIFLYSLFLIRK